MFLLKLSSSSKLIKTIDIIQDMIKSCSFGGGPPSASCEMLRNNTALKVFTPGMGVCHVFNFGSRNQSENLSTETSNSNAGLRLEIDIECKIIITNQSLSFQISDYITTLHSFFKSQHDFHSIQQLFQHFFFLSTQFRTKCMK